MSQPAEKLAEASNPDWPFDEWGTARPDLNFVREYYLSDLSLCDKLLDLFNEWTPDAVTRRRILADNPAKLYGFPL